MFPEDRHRGIRKFLLCSVLAQRTAGTFFPYLAVVKKLLDAMGHLHCAGHLSGSFSEGNCCNGQKERGAGFPLCRT